jgi:hypothetical protein
MRLRFKFIGIIVVGFLVLFGSPGCPLQNIAAAASNRMDGDEPLPAPASPASPAGASVPGGATNPPVPQNDPPKKRSILKRVLIAAAAGGAAVAVIVAKKGSSNGGALISVGQPIIGPPQ